LPGIEQGFMLARCSRKDKEGNAMGRKWFYLILLVFGLASSVGLQGADSQQTAPKDNKGFKAEVKQVVDLGPEIDGMNGRQLRMRLLTIEPGGYIGIHSHKDRPAVVYFLQGTDTVTLEDGTTKVFRPGDTSSANKDTTHWHRNDGKEPVVLIAVDVFHKAN
jgi:quercetin dioxygenase-like cupin family protein